MRRRAYRRFIYFIAFECEARHARIAKTDVKTVRFPLKIDMKGSEGVKWLIRVKGFLFSLEVSHFCIAFEVICSFRFHSFRFHSLDRYSLDRTAARK